jgi:hypothetical protein
MKRHLLRSSLYSLAAVALVYFIAAYLVLPWVWSHYEHQPGLAAHPAITVTPQGIPGDPLNVGLVGEKASVIRALLRAGWTPADPITLKSSLEIAESVVLDRPYRDAPVSTLLYEGRKQDLAFEKPIGTSADRRNHVRFWLVLDKGAEGRPVWLGSATLDHGVGVSHYTGHASHRCRRRRRARLPDRRSDKGQGGYRTLSGFGCGAHGQRPQRWRRLVPHRRRDQGCRTLS